MFANMAIIFGSTLNRSACVSDKYFNVDLIIRVLWFYSCFVRFFNRRLCNSKSTLKWLDFVYQIIYAAYDIKQSI